MKVNWKRFAGFFLLFSVVTFLSGCTASWVGAINALWPALKVAIDALFAFLMSVTTLPASASAFVQKIEADVKATLQNATNLLATLASSATATVTQEFQAALQFITTNLQSILSGINVVDPGTVSTATRLINLIIAAIEAILMFLPLLMSKTAKHASKEDLMVADKIASNGLSNAHKLLQHDYHAAVQPTGDAAVDAALAPLPQTLP
jgi:phage-related protein